MSTLPINPAGASPAWNPPAVTPAATGTEGAAQSSSAMQAASGAQPSLLSTEVQFTLSTLGNLSTSDLLLLVLLSMLEKDKEEKSSLAPALLLFAAATMQATVSLHLGDEWAGDAASAPVPASGSEPTGGTVDVSA